MSDLNNAFDESIRIIEDKIFDQVMKNIDKACEVIEEEAKKKCPPLLKESISREVYRNNNIIIGKVGSSNIQAPYVHQGTGIYELDTNERKIPKIYNNDSISKNVPLLLESNTRQFLEEAKLNNINKVETILREGLV